MSKKWLFGIVSLAILICLLIVLPINTTEDEPSFKQIASEKTLPEDFSAGQVYKAEKQQEFDNLWKYFELPSKDSAVNFQKSDVYFIGMYEPGNCPYSFEDLRITSDGIAMKLYFSGADGMCTRDATPRTFILEVDKKTSMSIQQAVIIKDGSEEGVEIK